MEQTLPVTNLDPRQRIAVLVHWLKSLSAIHGNALDGAEMAGRVAGYDGESHLAPAWIMAWEGAGRPLHGIEMPPPLEQKVVPRRIPDVEDDSPEVKEMVAIMDPLDTFLLENRQITDKESDLLIGCWWALHDVDHRKAMAFLSVLDRLLRGGHVAAGPKKKAKP